MYYVYIIYSPSHDKYYVGQTQDVNQRLLEQNELSEGSYTSKYRPWELRLSLPVPTRSSAIRLEAHIKGKKRRSFIEVLLSDVALQDRLIKEFSDSGSVG